MPDYIARSFLFFSSDLFIIPLIIIGFIGFNRSIFFHAACLVLLSMLLNVALKNTFQIPLAPALGKVGYAFPSGHMQLVTVLYCWLALRLRKIGLFFIIIPLLVSIGLSLIHFGYHDFYDVCAGVFFALLLITVYSLAYLKWPIILPVSNLVAASLLFFYIGMRSTQIAAYVWMAYYTLWGLVLAENFANKKAVVLKHKWLALVLCFLTVSLISLVFYVLCQAAVPVYIYQFQWFLIGFVIPWSNFYAKKLINQLKPLKWNRQ